MLVCQSATILSSVIILYSKNFKFGTVLFNQSYTLLTVFVANMQEVDFPQHCGDGRGFLLDYIACYKSRCFITDLSVNIGCSMLQLYSLTL